MNLLHMLKNQKGAMFGMDARVAMAIFAVLSVAVGYYSFGKLRNARDANFLKELQELSVAFQEMQADMGVFLPYSITSGSDGDKDFAALWDSSNIATGIRSQWNGPYFTIESATHRDYGTYSITYGQDNSSMSACTNTSACFGWLTLTDVEADKWDRINSHIDEARGDSLEGALTKHETGAVRADDLTDPRILYYKAFQSPRFNKW